MARRNIELKARCSDLDRARDVIQRMGARFDRTMSQRDTYFHVAHGRLKLREIASGDDRSAELIWYERADAAVFRDSLYHVTPVAEAAVMKEALSCACSVRGEVGKSREVWLYGNVRIHLDRVEGLGTYIEFEAVMSDGEDDGPSRRRLEQLHAALRIEVGDHESRSYSDLLGV